MDTNTSSVPKTPSMWPAVGGGLLALGLALSLLPGLFRDATDLTSPFYEPMQLVGGISLALAAIIFAALIVRLIAHIGRQTPVR